MGMHKLEVEVDDETLSMIDSILTDTDHTREDVLLTTSRERMVEILSDRKRTQKHIAFMKAIEMAGSHSSNLTSEEILREVKESRGDE